MHCRFLCAGLLASVAAGAGAAVAADIPARPGSPPPILAAPANNYGPDWTGFYAGIHGGGGSGHTSFDPAFFENDTTVLTSPNLSPSGGVFGGQFGYNWQWGPVVGGLEVDFSGADLKESTSFFDPFGEGVLFTAEHKIDALASARGRLGYVVFPSWLLYGTAGLGWAHSRFTTTESFDGIFASNTSYANEFGWVAGVGLEWKFAEHWLLRGEWLHYDFGRTNQVDLVNAFGATLNGFDNVRTTVDIGRAALSYKF